MKTHSFLVGILVLLFLSACNYTMRIRDGEMAHDRKQYAVAMELLQKEIRKADSRIEKGQLAFLLGESYEAINQPEKAIQWYQTAYDNGAGVEALEKLAYALKQNEQYREALDAFKNLGFEIGSPYEYRREISACETAMGWNKIERPEYSIDPLDFNSSNADYAPAPYQDGRLVFTSDRSTGEKKEDIYNWTGNPFSDLFITDLSTLAVEPFDNAINTEHNEGTIAFNGDFTEAFFTRCFGGKKEDAYCKLVMSRKVGNNWSRGEVLPFVAEGVNYMHPAVSTDGNTLYFTANHPDGWGGYDIYVSERTLDGWTEPQLLSRSVNTSGNEQFPYLDQDTLYFSSDFHTGMGGLDIFRTYKLSNGSWAPAFNLKPPINSGADDFAFVVDYQSERPEDVIQTGYFTSKRELGLGGDDIYRYERRYIPPPPKEEEEEEEIVYQNFLDVYVLEKIYADPTDPNSRVLGRKPLTEAKLQVEIGGKEQEVELDESGKYTIELQEGIDYEFLASQEGYLKKVEAFTSKGIGKDPLQPVQRFELEIVLEKIFLNTEIVLENIYYDFDKWDIREDAEPTLNELAQNLELNPDINIELVSHTDCRGNDAYNQDLSQKRAQSAVDYLIQQGISPGRLTAIGAGENEPAVDCICARCTEEEHQQNRRTAFRIVQ